MNQSEPVTALTDYVLSLECVVLGVLLLRAAGLPAARSRWLWALSFLSTALAAAAGGTFHSLAPSWSVPAAKLLWHGTILTIGVAGALMLAGAVCAAVSHRIRTLLLIAVAAKLALFVAWILPHPEYRFVVFDYAAGMIAVLILQAYFPTAATAWIVTGVLVSWAAGAIQISGLSLHQNLNQNDIYHVIQMAAMFLFYRGGLRLQDRPG